MRPISDIEFACVRRAREGLVADLSSLLTTGRSDISQAAVPINGAT